MEIIYDEKGQCYNLVWTTPTGQAVAKPVWEEVSCDGEETWMREGDPVVLRVWFKEPPLPKLDTETAAAQSRLNILQENAQVAQQRLYTLERDLAQKKAEIEATLTKSKQLEPLKRVIDILEGRLGWCVVGDDYNCEVRPLADATKTTERHSIEKARLLSLMGASGGDLGWRINSYSDGSGSYQAIHFFETEEEARAFARPLWLSIFNKTYCVNYSGLLRVKAALAPLSESEQGVYEDAVKRIRKATMDHAKERADKILKEAEKTLHQLNLVPMKE